MNQANFVASFKDSYIRLYGALKDYKDNDRMEQEASMLQVVNDFRMGNCDPGRFSKRYEILHEYKQRRKLV